MDITLPILILAIPFLMFLILRIGGVKIPRKLAGVLGILGMGSVMTLSYVVALTYFFSGDAAFIVDGVRQQLRYSMSPGSHSPTGSWSTSASCSIPYLP